MAYVRADHIAKRFRLQKDRADSVGQLLLRMLPQRGRATTEPFWALKDVSFEMPPGRSLGIIGHNGAGKSTLLKILTRTLSPTTGSLTVRGRVSALIELGAGFHPDFTGRENVILNASILGIGRREVTRRMDDIIDFSGIRPFIDTPVKYYSSGMHARLGFSVAIHVDPELLIVDEVLAVGDAAFQEQCMERIFRMKRAGVSILLVTHDLAAVERLMDDVLWLDHGEVRQRGDPHQVVDAYRRSTLPPTDASTGAADTASPTLGPHIAQAMLIAHPAGAEEDGGLGRRVQVFIENPMDVPFAGYLSARICRPDGLLVAGISQLDDGESLMIAPRRGLGVTLTMDASVLASGTYDIELSLSGLASPTRLGPCPRVTLRVAGGARHGIVAVPHRWGQPSPPGETHED